MDGDISVIIIKIEFESRRSQKSDYSVLVAHTGAAICRFSANARTTGFCGLFFVPKSMRIFA